MSVHAAGYVNASCFGKPGQGAARVLAKGWLVAVPGRLLYREWHADDGSKRHGDEVMGNVEFLAAPRGNDATTAAKPKETVAL
jgi:single-stranded DNA-binding protein